ncbi:MAG: helix-turn-helix domain-containing protein [Candidatus Sumerlaeia bacterium]
MKSKKIRQEDLPEDILELFENADTVEEVIQAIKDNIPDWDSDPDFQYEYIRAQIALDIRRIMDDKGLSVQAVSDRAGMKKQQLSKILSEQGNLTLKTLCRIGAALGSHVGLRLAQKGEQIILREYTKLPEVETIISFAGNAKESEQFKFSKISAAFSGGESGQEQVA